MPNPYLADNNPFFPETIDRFLKLLHLTPAALILDAGCGEGALLNRLMTHFQCSGIGVDVDTEALAGARNLLSRFGDRVTLIEKSVLEAGLETLQLDAAFCIGATHAFGPPVEGYRTALQTFQKIVKPGGYIVVGEGYWKKPPDPEYLSATGISAHESLTFEENSEIAEEMGLRPIYALRATDAEWDHFESAFWAWAEEQLHQDPDNQELQAKADHWRNWRRAYLKWGRDTMGFALYAFRT